MYQPKLDNEETKLEVIRLSQEGLSNTKIARIIGVNESSVRNFLNKKSYRDFWEVYDAGIVSGTSKSPECQDRLDESGYVITSAQNNTWVDHKFFESILRYCEARGFRLLISTYHYNKNGFQNNRDEDVWYDPIIRPYIADFPAKLADDLLYCGELNILPTAVTPLSGLGTYTKNCSGIVPHAKVQLESQPRQKGQDPRFLYTTGCITVRNYIDMKAGQKAAFHHVVGALVVEIDEDGDWYARQIAADDNGGFYDLDTYYSPDSIKEGCSIGAVTWADIHAEDTDLEVREGMFGEDSILDALRPKVQFMHDLVSFRARNHHNRNDPYFKFKAFVENRDSVINDIDAGIEALEESDREWSERVVVSSNHDQALVRWLKETDYRSDPKNAIFFLEMQLSVYKAMERGMDINVLEYALKYLAQRKCGLTFERVTFLDEDKSFILKTDDSYIECGNHGHLGNNGARGSIKGFAKLGTKQNVGHSHTCGIFDGVYQAGTATYMDMGYNKGPSSWSHSHILVYPNGKRAIVTQRGSKWRA